MLLPGDGNLPRVIRTELLTALPTLTTARTRLVPMGPQFFPQVWRALQDQEVRRLTGTHTVFTQDQVRSALETWPGRDDRADWAIIRSEDSSYLGEVTLNQLDRANASMNYRVALRGSDVFGQGYGTEAGDAVVNFGLGLLGLHRISLGVYAFNERAIGSYRKLGFELEGRLRQALCWDDQWYDEIVMSVLAPGSQESETSDLPESETYGSSGSSATA